MQSEDNAEKSSEGVKKLVLTLHARVPVDTSQGTYFARHMNVGDIKSFGEYFDGQKDKRSTDLRALGERALKVLVCDDKEANKTPALTDNVYFRLTADDLRALAKAVSQACRVTLPSDDDPVGALGSAMFDMMVKHARKMAEASAEIKRTLDSNFGSISATVKAALGENMAGLSAIREGLKMSSAVEAVRKAQEDKARLLGSLSKDLTGASAATEILRKAQEDCEGMLGGLAPGLTSASSAAEALRKAREAQGLAGHAMKDLAGLTAASEAMLRLQEDPLRVIGGIPKSLLDEQNRNSTSTQFNVPDHLLRLPPMPRVEETPMGRAAIAGEKSALQLQEVAGLVGQMTEQLGAMHELFLVKVVPQWVENLKNNGQTASTSIGLAKQAIYWSIFVTVAMTVLQLGVAQYYRSEDDEQQKASKVLVQLQLDASLELNKQLAADSKRLQDELAKLSKSVSALQAPKTSAAAKPKDDMPQH